MQPRDIDVLLLQMQFPGMPQLESNIARAWIRQYAKDYDKLDFNVRLGKGQATQPGIDDTTAGQFEKISRQRADIIAWTGPYVDIVEVKDRAKSSTMGQVIGYRHLWTDDNPTLVVRRLIVVSPFIDPDVQRIFTANGIVFYIMEPEAREIAR